MAYLFIPPARDGNVRQFTLQSTRTGVEQRGRESIPCPPNRSYEISGVICVQVRPPSVVFRRNEEAAL